MTSSRLHRGRASLGYFLLITLGAIVLAFMGLSLAITATGTARFAVAMCYRADVDYAVGAIFDFAKALLPVALLVLLARRAFLFFGIIGFAWLGLVTYSALATHATVGSRNTVRVVRGPVASLQLPHVVGRQLDY